MCSTFSWQDERNVVYQINNMTRWIEKFKTILLCYKHMTFTGDRPDQDNEMMWFYENKIEQILILYLNRDKVNSSNCTTYNHWTLCYSINYYWKLTMNKNNVMRREVSPRVLLICDGSGFKGYIIIDTL